MKTISARSRAAKNGMPADLNTPEAVEHFRKAARAFTKSATVSREAALAVLVKEGIATKSGKLTKRYR